MTITTAERKTPSYDISLEGQRLVKDYQLAIERVKRAESELNSARCEQVNARRALVRWCSPSDAKPGEKFGIWSRDQYGNEVLIEARTEYAEASDGDYPGALHESTINLRYRK
jgi:hypothetical protein